ncbi:hypothetical protein [Mangrovihabitans endophyticus]|uniref:Uncharacterized protein n=1 Tax=Mangrovihabitans endophyticus TaxID=1751298 RepID=A0A8J3FNR1_9ACTN|nr:hypothetical protein [Mangrovihabitans endophyticus]GGK89080.1 hypothetical protein GCM10012284_23900 [Mangrovihabitans endophyticus]
MTAGRPVRPVRVVNGRHPYEVAILAASACCGLALALTDTSPRSAATAMPGVVEVLWQVLLVAGGVIGLFGAFWPGRLVAQLGTEAAGVVLLGTATSMYSVALFAVAGLQALAAGAFVAAAAVASWVRLWQIGRDLPGGGRGAGGPHGGGAAAG